MEWFGYIIGAVFMFWKIPAAIAFTYFIWKVVNKKGDFYLTAFYTTIVAWWCAFDTPSKEGAAWIMAFLMFSFLLEVLAGIKMTISELRTEIENMRHEAQDRG